MDPIRMDERRRRDDIGRRPMRCSSGRCGGGMSNSSGIRMPVALLRMAAFVGLLAMALASGAAQSDETNSGPPSDNVTERDRQFWSFQKVVRPAVPHVTAPSLVR